MKVRYRIVHQRKSIIVAMMHGRSYTDWYIAQHRRWYGWRELGTYASEAEAEAACEHHAGGKLLTGGRRIVSEFVRFDED